MTAKTGRVEVSSTCGRRPTINETDGSAIHSRRQIEIETASKSHINSKQLLKVMSAHELPLLNEEIFVFLLKFSSMGVTKQKELSQSLIKGFVNYIKKVETKGTTQEYINSIKKNFEKIMKVIKKIGIVVGGLDNTTNYISRLLSLLFQISKQYSISEIKLNLISKLEEYNNVRLCKSREIIIKTGVSLIKKDDCILIYGLNANLKSIFSDESLKKDNIKFSIIYIQRKDNPKTYEEVKFLTSLGIEVVYSCIVSISNIIQRASKIFLRAKSMLSNGNLLGEPGNSLIANVAYNFKKPVIVFSETFKFWNKIQIDSFHSPNIFFYKDKTNSELSRLGLNYDITPANVINMVVCELGYIPATSVKVVIREYVCEDIDLDKN